MTAAGSMTDDATVTVLRELATGAVLDDDTAALLAAHPQIDVISGQHLQLAVLDRLRAEGAELGRLEDRVDVARSTNRRGCGR